MEKLKKELEQLIDNTVEIAFDDVLTKEETTKLVKDILKIIEKHHLIKLFTKEKECTNDITPTYMSVTFPTTKNPMIDVIIGMDAVLKALGGSTADKILILDFLSKYMSNY